MKKLGIVLFLIFLTHQVVAQSPAIEALKAKAQAGDPKAQNQLGVRYLIGDGVEKDPKQAVEWYRKAAHSGYADALFNLGTAYYNGDGVGVDDSAALAYFAAASERGSAPAADAIRRLNTELDNVEIARGYLLLGDMLAGNLQNAQDVLPRDYQAARRAFEKSAEFSPAALIHLAQMELGGKGGPPNAEKAKEYCLRADKLHDPSGSYCVGLLYENGKLGQKDYQVARDWYLKAAKRGFAPAAYNLGNLYAQGNGVAADPIAAFGWYCLGADGDARAKAAFDQLSQKLSAKDQSKGAKLAKKFLDDNNIGMLTKR